MSLRIPRNAFGLLKVWLSRPLTLGRKPLIVRGARQTGKSTLVRMFAEREGLDLIEVNLEKEQWLEPVFASLDAQRILREISIKVGRKIDLARSILFLDEIQATPSALPALRYFYEDIPSLPVIAAGSLLEFTLGDHPLSMPVGRIEYLHLGPLSLQEFLQAAGDEYLLNVMKEFQPNEVFPEAAHRQLLARLREYLMVGGMPEAVRVYLSTERDPREVKRVQDSILATYQDDFAKYATKSELFRLQSLFRKIPGELARKVKYSRLLPDEKSRDVRAAIELLIKAKILFPVFHSDCSGVPLGAISNRDVYKLMFLDVGLAVRAMGLDWYELLQEDERTLVNEGPLAEQFIAQNLFASADQLVAQELYYWLREGKINNAEVDFVLQRGKRIIPIEVKAGKSGTLKSLRQYCLEKSPAVALRFDLNPPSESQFDNIKLISLPLYMIEEVNRLIPNRDL